ncbi:MAG: redoxin domain-containing protein [Tannerellaceae bacterium]|nr:redoxin domain-containing protein [Tannerellaceae bacterium]
MYKHATVIFLVLFFAFGCIKDEKIDGEGSIIGIGDRLPSLNLILSDGTYVTDNLLSGKIVVILLFTTECPNCRQQLPAIEALYQTFQGQEDIIILE